MASKWFGTAKTETTQKGGFLFCVGEGYFDENSFLPKAKKVRRRSQAAAIGGLCCQSLEAGKKFWEPLGAVKTLPMQSTHPSITEHILYRTRPIGRFFVLRGGARQHLK